MVRQGESISPCYEGERFDSDGEGKRSGGCVWRGSPPPPPVHFLMLLLRIFLHPLTLHFTSLSVLLRFTKQPPLPLHKVQVCDRIKNRAGDVSLRKIVISSSGAIKSN
ncbi:hypothetical protein B566_EDAN004509, partial [Ephemera danica]